MKLTVSPLGREEVGDEWWVRGGEVRSDVSFPLWCERVPRLEAVEV